MELEKIGKTDIIDVSTKKEGICMSDREKAVQLLNAIPDYKIGYIVSYLQGYVQGMTDGEEIPNAETLEAFAEVDEMKRTGSGQRFDNLDDLWSSLEE